MRRKWGSLFHLNFLRNGAWSKLPPRRWGKRSLNLRKPGSLLKPPSRKWGTGQGIFVQRGSPNLPVKKFSSVKPRKRMRRKHYWSLMALLFLFIVVQATLFLDRELRGPLMFLAKIKINQMATEAINTAISAEVAQSTDSDQLIQWKTNAEGKITGFLIDYKEQMAITARTIEVVNRVLDERDSVPEHIPIGHALNSPFLSSIGPSVSVTFHPASAVKVDVETKQTETGINNLLVEVYVRIRTEIAVVIPFDQAPEMLETIIPLSYVLVVGDVPTYYYDNHGVPTGNGAAQAPSIALPSPPS